MFDYFGTMALSEKKYATQNKKFTYDQSIYALEDFIRRNSNGGNISAVIKTCLNLIFEFMSGENEDTDAIFDVKRFESFLYSLSVKYTYGDKLDGVVLEQDLYEPLFEVEKVVQKKRKKEIPDGGETKSKTSNLENQVTELSAEVALLMEALKNAKPVSPKKSAKPTEPSGGGKSDNKWVDIGADSDDSAL